ncbi:hypothetical protein DY138_03140 [Apilactobacillus timberlakei]|uniref:hypothetical protein n=1 Tax=Apilactobacillus timberlakei TaxID=2008380 RepID=UPI00112E8278|nr:hypothetical protein [Apilactobacillus timberlakei]TPR19656.1 hypothetical protein DY138_03140 [Apilactobacillus timberlakei]TPR20633.1 hypothetical protein DY061_04780 [Apilactobacillus timberlakei]TPR22676.1 hypothetical protein DY083_04050 [Apilactobacillus timberlakei]
MSKDLYKSKEYSKGMQQALTDQNTYEYLKEYKIMKRIYLFGINNKLRLRRYLIFLIVMNT